ncbi:MAG TPA: SpoIVB peptidase S55 domain-containing protein [Vicinamibacterales bacterium]|nr:SpoIVB peptidase S55 domain-containing protein [Vicinamibacterales bacterium]
MRGLAIIAALWMLAAAGAPAQSKYFPIEDVRPGMIGIGRTVFEGDRLDEFKVNIIGVLHNQIGPRRDLVLARLEGGPLAKTGVIAGMSGSPVYIDGRLLGAVSYSLGEFATEPIAGITPIAEMVEAATLPPVRRTVARVDLPVPFTQEAVVASLRQSFASVRPFADSPADVRVLGGSAVGAGVGTLLRPIATPISFGGFSPASVDSLAALFRDQGFLPVAADAAAQTQSARTTERPLGPGDAIGVSLLSGDLQIGATGTVTEVSGNRVYAFGHPFYGLGPIQFPLTRARVLTVLPSLSSSMKISSTGPIIGVVQQDRATTIAGTLGEGPALIPLTLTLKSERGTSKTFTMQMVSDQLLTPLVTYTAISETLTSYERQNGVASYAIRGSATVKKHGTLAFEDLFSGDQPSAAASAYVVGPINFLLRNSFEDVDLERVNLEIDASEQPRSATLERAWIDGTRPKPGSTVTLKVLLRTYRGEQVTTSVPVQIPPNARGSVSMMVTDGVRLSQWEARELQVQPTQTRDVTQMMRVLNEARKNNRLYVRLVTRDGGAVIRGESLAALPPSVLAVLEADRDGGNFKPLQSALLGEWEIPTDYAVSGSRTLTIPLQP